MTGPDIDADEGPGRRPFRRRVLINTAAVGVSNIWAMAVALVSLPLILHGLGTVAFGTWALLLTFSAVNGWFSLLDLGLGVAATREVASRHAVDDRPGLGAAVGSTIALLGLLGAASGTALAVLGPRILPTVFNTPERLRHELTIAIMAFSVQVALDLLGGGFMAVLDGYQRVDLARVVDIARRTLVAAAASFAALWTHRLGAVGIASAGATAVGTLIGAAMLVVVARGCSPSVHRSMIRTLLGYGATVAVLRPLGVIHRTVDRFVVGAVLGPAAVTLVEVATQLQAGADAVLSATSYAVVPGAARLHAQREHAKLVELVETGTRYVLLATWPVAMLTAVLAAPAIDLWVGPRYADAAGLVALGIIAVALAAPAQVGSNLLLGTGHAVAILRVALLAIVVNVTLSIVLVDEIGIAGAFVATIVAATIALPLLLRAVLDELDLGAGAFVRTALVPALTAPLAAGVAAGVVVGLPLGNLATLVLGGTSGLAAAAGAAYRWGLSPPEAAMLRNRLPGR